jgi:hypothetical protein
MSVCNPLLIAIYLALIHQSGMLFSDTGMLLSWLLYYHLMVERP